MECTTLLSANREPKDIGAITRLRERIRDDKMKLGRLAAATMVPLANAARAGAVGVVVSNDDGWVSFGLVFGSPGGREGGGEGRMGCVWL